MQKFFALYVLLFVWIGFAQAQQISSFPGMNYQAVARDAAGKLLAKKTVFLRVNLLSDGPTGSAVYSEIHQVTTNENGLFNLVIGKGESKGKTFQTIPWAEKNIWLELALSESKKEAFSVIGASQLLAVPYAYHAGSAETLHFHENNEKSSCSRVAAGMPFWTVNGNDKVSDECHFIGTTVDEDLVFKTNNVERLRILADGRIDMPGNLFIHGNLTVDGDGSFFNLNTKNDLTVGKNGTVGKDLSVGNNGSIAKDLSIGNQTATKILQVNESATVNGPLTTNGRLIVNGGADGSQSKQESYPLLVKGSTQGIAIEVTPTTNSNLESGRGNNYVSFWKNGAMTGRIEGMNTGDLDPSGLVGLITKMVTDPPPGISYKFGDLVINLLPKVDVDASFDPFSVDVVVTLPNLNLDNPFTRLPGNFLEFIENPTGGPASFIYKNIFEPIACDPQTGLFTIGAGPEAATNFKSQIFSNYTLDILTNSVVVFGSIVETVTSLASVLDPEDIFSDAFDLVIDVTNLTLVATYADLSLGVAFESGSGDYAEWLPRVDPAETMSIGDVVGVNGGKVSKKFSQAERFMVVSASPIVLGNMPSTKEGEKNSEKIAFMGQVPVKARGVVNIGDYLLPSGEGDGLAIAVAPDKMKARDFKRIIGVAWEAADGSEFFKLINTAVGLNQNDTGKLIEEMQMVINQMQKAIQELKPDYQPHLFEVGETTLANRPAAPDFTVSNTHPSQMDNYFQGKNYSNRQEMLQDVKKALVERANINLDRYPLIAYMFDHPEQAQDMAKYYNQVKETLSEAVGKRK
ncbi:MAG: polymer-forming cytoskeletal protein [Haliscomenobacter sp.]|uniref:polymer-forming cytoskeletal protein n=1 Tax=Haliscomenobacter sp. TaxID=2717303 RepID=UPI0029BD36D4|nr:polymer-forming cytoskeletal protein [Haliscomenobacter sp.]MDX2072116.1 polymer-forming cytoskeletal protein [Haliscomenobacter sp.]